MQILGKENEIEIFKEGCWIITVAKFVEKYGLNDFDTHMEAIEEITQRNTDEYTIWLFAEGYPKRVMGKKASCGVRIKTKI